MSLEVPGITLENEGSGWNPRTSTCSIPGGERGAAPKVSMYLLIEKIGFSLASLIAAQGLLSTCSFHEA